MDEVLRYFQCVTEAIRDTHVQIHIDVDTYPTRKNNYVVFPELRTKPRALCLQDKCFTTELNSQP